MSKNILLYAASEINSDIYYATRFWAPDPFTCLIQGKKKTLLVSQLEYGRAKKEASVDELVMLDEIFKKIKSNGSPSVFKAVVYLLKTRKINKVQVPYYFPVYFAEYLKKNKIGLDIIKTDIFPKKIRKTEQEINMIKQSVRTTEEAIKEAFNVLKDSRIKGNRIYYERKPVTSEFLRGIINSYLISRGYESNRPIVACGIQACDPHQIGSGYIKPHQSIIFDVFPRSMKTRYHADISRTVVKGRPSKKLLDLYNTVREGQQLGCSLVKANADGRKIHNEIVKYFEKKGYTNSNHNGKPIGFIHGTGHGLGLDVHEYPRISPYGNRLAENMVVTVEPGLYYPGIGGVRIEDDVVVRKNRCQNLVKLHTNFIIE